MLKVSRDHGKLTPWINSDEWEQVHRWIFADDKTLQRRALSRINAWQSRHPVPLAVESTADFMSFELGQVDDASARLGLGMAIIRFVNGLVDQKQSGSHAASVARLAQTLNLPHMFVELRMEATHKRLPSLPMLRLAAKQALTWLRENYWAKRGDHETHRATALAPLLQQYLTSPRIRVRRLMLAVRAPRARAALLDLLPAALLSHCEPTLFRLDPHPPCACPLHVMPLFESLRDKWAPLLHAVVRRHPAFRVHLLHTLLKSLVSLSTSLSTSVSSPVSPSVSSSSSSVWPAHARASLLALWCIELLGTRVSHSALSSLPTLTSLPPSSQQASGVVAAGKEVMSKTKLFANDEGENFLSFQASPQKKTKKAVSSQTPQKEEPRPKRRKQRSKDATVSDSAKAADDDVEEGEGDTEWPAWSNPQSVLCGVCRLSLPHLNTWTRPVILLSLTSLLAPPPAPAADIGSEGGSGVPDENILDTTTLLPLLAPLLASARLLRPACEGNLRNPGNPGNPGNLEEVEDVGALGDLREFLAAVQAKRRESAQRVLRVSDGEEGGGEAETPTPSPFRRCPRWVPCPIGVLPSSSSLPGLGSGEVRVQELSLVWPANEPGSLKRPKTHDENTAQTHPAASKVQVASPASTTASMSPSPALALQIENIVAAVKFW